MRCGGIQQEPPLLTTTFSLCKQYRYTLHRQLPATLLGNPTTKVAAVLANPSVADEAVNDPTVARFIKFVSRLDCCDLVLLNCFALISTDPDALMKHTDPIGPLNDYYIKRAAGWADKIVVAWGTLGIINGRNLEVLRILKRFEGKLLCLGRTQDGHPRHPLYLRSSTPFEPYSARDMLR